MPQRPLTERPCALLAIAPWARDGVYPAELMQQLCRLVELNPALNLAALDDDTARAALRTVEILLTGWGCPRIDAETVRAAPRLRAVVHAAGSVKALVDLSVFQAGIAVSSAAAANAVPVAEYTVAALVLAGKRVVTRARWYAGGLPAGDWRTGAGTGLFGCTVGILGASMIGRLVLERLRSFEVRVLLCDPYVSPGEARALGAELVDADELCRRSDLVSLHAPALPETRHVLDDRRLALLRTGAAVVNTARGALIDTEALTRHCASGRISAVLDVTDPEPLPPGHPLFELPNVLVTPHLAGAQGRELRRLGEFALGEVYRLVHGQPMRGRVAAADLSRIA